MGGGTTMMEANRIGCSITGTDINPMAWWIVRQEIFDLDVNAYLAEANRLRRHLESEIGHLYRTRCLKCGSGQALVKYFLWVKTVGCNSCKQRIDMFPNFMVSEDVRHPANVFVCVVHVVNFTKRCPKKIPALVQDAASFRRWN